MALNLFALSIMSLCVAAYYLFRWVFAVKTKQDTSYFGKGIGISLVVAVLSFAFMLNSLPTSTPKEQEAREAARLAEEKRIAEEKAAEEKRLAEEQKAREEARLAEEKRIADEKAAEEKRLAEEKRAQEIAERERRREKMIIAEREAFWEWDAEIKRGIAVVDDDWEQLWQYTLTDFSNGYIDAPTAFQTLRELEHRLIEDEMIFRNAAIPQEISSMYRSQMNSIKNNFAEWAKMRRKGCEKFRFALADNAITPQSAQQSLDLINKGDVLMLKGNMDLGELENKIGEQKIIG